MGKLFITHNYLETQKIAQEFAKKLKGGEVIALYGELGAGKTTFIQGLAKGLGIEKRIISPTFIIVRTYEIKLKTQSSKLKATTQYLKFFYHIDLYRVEGQHDIEGLGIEEIVNDPNSIIAIEWAEKLGKLLPKKRWNIIIESIDKNERKIQINEIIG